MRGKTTDGFIHIADWYTTFCKLAGVDSSDSGEGKFPVDGLDVWPILTGESSSTLHNEIVLGYDFDGSHPNQGAIIVGNYKLIVQPQAHGCDSVMWSPLDYPCSQGENGPDCNPYCLYDIVNDPYEKKDLSAENPDKLKELLEKYNMFSKEPRAMQDQGYHSEAACPSDRDACQYMRDNGGYWRPWKNVV